MDFCNRYLHILNLAVYIPLINFWKYGYNISDRKTENCVDIQLSSEYEATEWLRENRNPAAFAGNRFGSTREAIAFVEQLYEAGAKRVYIDRSSIYSQPSRIYKEGGQYADALTVDLPSDSEKRRQLIKIYEQETRQEGLLKSGCIAPAKRNDHYSRMCYAR